MKNAWKIVNGYYYYTSGNFRSKDKWHKVNKVNARNRML